MELCTTKAVSNLPQTPKHHIFPTLNPTNLQQPSYSLPLRRASVALRLHSRILCSSESFPRATTSKETSDRPNSNLGETPEVPIVVQDLSPAEQNVDGDESESKEESGDEQTQTLDLKLETDSGDVLSVLFLGGGALLTLWLASAFVGAIDAIPLFPKVMEIVGIGYSVWFTTRYLLFKKNREELALKVEELKQQVLGSDDDVRE